MVADPRRERPLRLCGSKAAGPWTLDFRPAIEALVHDSARQSAKAAKFHNTLAAATVDICHRISQESGLRRVCLSGGSFQNVRLLASVASGLRSQGLEVFLHANVPPNDGGIALGQAAIAASRIAGRH